MLPLFFSLLLAVFSLSNAQFEECYQPFCSCRPGYPLVMTCKDFESFKQLEFNEGSQKIWRSITFIGNAKAEHLNDDLNLSKLKFAENASIVFFDIKSIHVFSRVFKNLRVYENNGLYKRDGLVSIKFYNSEIKLTPGENLMDISEYTRCQYNENENAKYTFSQINVSELEFFDSKFTNDMLVCPLLFFRSNIDEIEFAAVNGKIGFRDVLFPLGAPPSSRTIGAVVKRVNVYGCNDEFVQEIDSSTLFNEHIFEKTRSIWVVGTYLNRIDDRTLQKLRSLKELHLEMIKAPGDKSMEIFRDTKWLENLNRGELFDFDKQLILNEAYFINNYFKLEIDEFPELLSDDNLCLVAKIPVNRLVVPILPASGCTCSTYYLYRYFLRNIVYATQLDHVRNCFVKLLNEDVTEKLQNCNLKGNCGITGYETTTRALMSTVRSTTMRPIVSSASSMQMTVSLATTSIIYLVIKHVF